MGNQEALIASQIIAIYFINRENYTFRRNVLSVASWAASPTYPGSIRVVFPVRTTIVEKTIGVVMIIITIDDSSDDESKHIVNIVTLPSIGYGLNVCADTARIAK